MKKLNNKGMTIIEILLCFVIVVGITLSLFTTLNNYRNKQMVESNRSQIIKYKNLITKEVEDDLIKRRVVLVNYERLDKDLDNNVCNDDHCEVFLFHFTFKDDSQKILYIKKRMAANADEDGGVNDKYDDSFLIGYGDSIDTMVKYTPPKLGSSKTEKDHLLLDFRINNINVSITENVFSLYIGFYHPNFERRYGIDIICPLNYE